MYKKSVYYEILRDSEPAFDLINIIHTISLIIIITYRTIYNIDTELLYLTYSAVTMGIGLYLFRGKIDIINKLTFGLTMLLIFVFRSFIVNGFIGSGFLILSLIITISIIFFSKTRGFVIVGLTLMTYLIIAILVNYDVIDTSYHFVSVSEYKNEWYAQAVLIIIISITVYFSIQTIKKRLGKDNRQLKNDHYRLKEQAILLKKQKKDLRDLAYTDRVTKLYNHYYLTEVLPSILDKTKENFLVGIIDITNLRVINSLYNQDIISDYLVEVIEKFKKELPINSYMGRYSTEELIFIIPNWNGDNFNKYLVKTSHSFKGILELISMNSKIPYHIGYTIWKKEETSLLECYKHCRVAVDYGVNNKLEEVIKYKKDMCKALEWSTKLLAIVKKAIDHDEFQIVFQGKHYLDQSRIMGYEALSRLNLDHGQSIPPSEFIPIINNSRYLIPFNKYIIRKSMKEFEKLQNQVDEKLTLSINISPLYLNNIHFVDFIRTSIENSSLSPCQVVLEITEDVFLDNSAFIIDSIKKLKDIGCLISIDDFGTGYSSFNQIVSLDIDELKIDRSFIRKILNNNKSLILVEAICQLALNLGLEIVAEGVENEEEVKMLESFGINIIQGYYFSKPQIIDEYIN